MTSSGTAGLDLGDRFSQICLQDAAGAVVLSQRVATTPTALRELLGGRSRLRIALESGTHSPWVSRLLARARCSALHHITGPFGADCDRRAFGLRLAPAIDRCDITARSWGLRLEP